MFYSYTCNFCWKNRIAYQVVLDIVPSEKLTLRTWNFEVCTLKKDFSKQECNKTVMSYCTVLRIMKDLRVKSEFQSFNKYILTIYSFMTLGADSCTYHAHTPLIFACLWTFKSTGFNLYIFVVIRNKLGQNTFKHL